MSLSRRGKNRAPAALPRECGLQATARTGAQQRQKTTVMSYF